MPLGVQAWRLFTCRRLCRRQQELGAPATGSRQDPGSVVCSATRAQEQAEDHSRLRCTSGRQADVNWPRLG
jgi:hypothetical protein